MWLFFFLAKAFYMRWKSLIIYPSRLFSLRALVMHEVKKKMNVYRLKITQKGPRSSHLWLYIIKNMSTNMTHDYRIEIWRFKFRWDEKTVSDINNFHYSPSPDMIEDLSINSATIPVANEQTPKIQNQIFSLTFSERCFFR